MSIATEIARIETNRNTIRTKLVELGLVASSATLDSCASAVEGIVKRGDVSVEILEGQSYTIPAGYHNGAGVVKAMTDTAGEAEKYKTQTKTVTPTKKQQSVTPDTGNYALSSVIVEAIPENYQDVSSTTAAAGDLLTGKVFVTKDGTVTAGTMPNNGAVSKTLDITSQVYSVPAGYHNGSGKVQVSLMNTSTVTPTKSKQTVTPSTGKLLSTVEVAAIPAEYQDVSSVDCGTGDVLEGCIFVNSDGDVLEGEIPRKDAVQKTLDTATTSVIIPDGYYGDEGAVSIVLETKTATPTKSAFAVTPTSGKVLSKVTVNAIPAAYQDVTGVTAGAADVLTGKKIVSSSGAVVNGSMANNGAIAATIDGLTSMSATVPVGYHNGSGKVTLTNDIENALKAI